MDPLPYAPPSSFISETLGMAPLDLESGERSMIKEAGNILLSTSRSGLASCPLGLVNVCSSHISLVSGFVQRLLAC